MLGLLDDNEKCIDKPFLSHSSVKPLFATDYDCSHLMRARVIILPPILSPRFRNPPTLNNNSIQSVVAPSSFLFVCC